VRKVFVPAVIIAVVATWAIDAQERLTFDVASIKRNRTLDQPPDLGIQPGGGLRTRNMPVFLLIWVSYGVQAYQVVDVPDWVRTETYDITANPPSGAPVSSSAVFARIQSLLEDRFGLRVRREQRQMPVYNLVTARTDGRLGPRLVSTTLDCAGNVASSTTPKDVIAGGCAFVTAPGRVMLHGYALGVFASIIAPNVNRVIVDRTGLIGMWNVDLDYAPDRVGPGVPAPPPDTPTLFTAIQEQLGLRLEPATGPAEVLRIEQVSRPSED
jgi:uncharacterized protein (TIGR03435 family)